MKIIGGFLIISASIICSYFYEKGLKLHIKELRDFKKFLEYISIQIEYFSYPLDKIYNNFQDKSTIIQEILEGNFSRLRGIEKEIKDSFLSLGNGYKKEQLKSLDYISRIVQKEIEALECGYEQRVKVFRAVSLFVGCSTVILLV